MLIRKIARNSFVEPLARWVYFSLAARRFSSSQNYWQKRYSSGGTSGVGSAGRLAQFKAKVLNEFIRREGISSVVEFGCGDGSQLALGEYPAYLGLDVSPAAVDLCRRRFAGDRTKSFAVLGTVDPGIHDAALSLDVIYHLIEDETFEAHMAAIFNSARRFVVVYSSNTTDPPPAPHVRHHRFTDWIEQHRPDWELSYVVRNEYPYDLRSDAETSFADFYFFKNTMHC